MAEGRERRTPECPYCGLRKIYCPEAGEWVCVECECPEYCPWCREEGCPHWH